MKGTVTDDAAVIVAAGTSGLIGVSLILAEAGFWIAATAVGTGLGLTFSRDS